MKKLVIILILSIIATSAFGQLKETADIQEKAVGNLLHPPEGMTAIGSPFAMQFMYEALEKAGEYDALLDSIHTKFQPMIDVGASTVWEMWTNPGNEQRPRFVTTLRRLVLQPSNGQVEADLEFGRDEQGTYFAVGSLKASVEMICQRCMTAMPVEVAAEIKLGFCGSDEMAQRIPERYEPCLVEEEPVALTDLIEDELILALPLVALHPEQSCQPWLEENQVEATEQEVTEERKNPFAVLEGLKQQK